ncbi:MAG: hypothetical protein J6S96_05155 [Muribaculaceae bacterium]|nr:hypothetical protein [Muribaculaceae bacterium]
MYFERWQIVVEGLLLAALAAATLCLFQPGDALAITAALAVAYLVPRIFYTSRSWCTRTGRIVFGLLSAMMVALAVLTIWNDTVSLNLPLSQPHLSSDDGIYYRWARHYFDGSCPAPNTAFIGFPLLMLATWKVFGMSIVWPLALNVMFTLVTVVVAAAITVRLLRERVKQSDRWLATLALCLTATLMFFISQGLRIQKEAIIYLAMSLLGYVLAGMNGRTSHAQNRKWHDLALWTVSCAILALGRNTYLYFVALGLIIVGISYWQANARKAAWLMLIVIGAFIIGNVLARYSVEGHIDIVKGGYYMQKQYLGSDVQQPYLDFVGKYFYYPVWQRLLLLPLTCAVQFIIPFPWLYGNFEILSYFPRIAWGWYIIGGIALFYFFTMSWRRGMNMGTWAWWPVSIYVIIAYVIAGTVSRYILPVEPMAVPIAVYVIAKLREGVMCRTFKWWAVIFVVVLVITLIVCYHIQLSYLNDLDNYYHSLMQ